MAAAMEGGEGLYPSTSADGREVVRSLLRQLKNDWDELYESVTDSQRSLDVNLVQWTTFEESYDQLTAWLSKMEVQLEKECPLLATAEEKKGQLHTYKVGVCDVELAFNS